MVNNTQQMAVEVNQSQRPSLYFYFVAASITITSFLFGYQAVILNTPQNVISQCYLTYDNIGDANSLSSSWDAQGNLLPPCLFAPKETWGLVSATFSVGGLIGSSIGGTFVRRWGARRLIMLTNCFLILGIIVMATSIHVVMLGFGRFMIGICLGIGSLAVSVYIVELSPTYLRGRMGSVPQIAFVIGMLVSTAFGLLLANRSGWRWLLALPAIPVVIQLGALVFCIESPKDLILRGQSEEAKLALSRIRSSNVDEEYNELTIINNDNSTGLVMTAWQLVCDSKFTHQMILNVMLQCMQQLVGVNVVSYYSTDIFAQSLPSFSPAAATVLVNCVSLCSTLIGAWLMDRSGRRPILLSSLFLSVIAMFIIVAGFVAAVPELILFGIIFFIAMFAFGLGPIPWLVMVEIFPSHAASAGATVGCTINWLLVIAVTSSFPVLQTALGQFVFVPYTCFGVVSFTYTYFCMPETKGRSSESISNSFKSFIILRWTRVTPHSDVNS